MSAATLGQEGLAALDRRDYDKAISALTAALAASASPKWLAARSKALIATSRFPEALADAESAYHLALDRGKRDLMLDAQYRRAVALHRLGKHADADVCLAWVMAAARGGKISDAEKSVGGVDAEGRYMVRREDVQALMAETTEEKGAGSDDMVSRMFAGASKEPPGGKIFTMAGTLRLSVLGAMQASPEDAEGRKLTVSVVPPKGDGPPKLVTQEAKPAATPAPKKLRIDAYETDEFQTISVFTRNVDKEQFKLQWLSDSKVVIGPLPEAPQGSAVIELGGEADKDKVSATVRPMKVELRIGKRTAAKYNTPKCYFSDGTPAGDQPSEPAPAAAPPTTTTTTTIPAPAEPKPAAKPAAYPTSSRSGPKNWDSIGADDDDDEGSGDPNHFFKGLYAGATDEQKRAMMKSFIESNGTALSTDWADVSNRTVETKPPEGVEAKQWD